MDGCMLNDAAVFPASFSGIAVIDCQQQFVASLMAAFLRRTNAWPCASVVAIVQRAEVRFTEVNYALQFAAAVGPTELSFSVGFVQSVFHTEASVPADMMVGDVWKIAPT